MTIKLLESEYENIIKVLGSDLENLKNKSILITGSNGLIASYLIDFLIYLNSHFYFDIKIHAMSRSVEKSENRFGKNISNLFFIEQDLDKPFSLNIDCDYIVHAASNSHPVAFSQKPVETMKTNLLGTMNILDSIKNLKTKFLYISTGEVYGNNTDGKAFTENDLGYIDTKIARSCYPESKRAAETLCMSYSKEYDIHTNVARLCYVYGPTITEDNSRADAQFLRNALANDDIVMKSQGLQRRTYCYVADAVSAIIFILLNGGFSEVYNIANPDAIVSVKDYAETLAKISNVKLKFELPNEVEKSGFSKPADSILDSSKLCNLGWKPQYDLETGLLHTLTLKQRNK